MRVRQFTVPFTKVVGEDATEIEYSEGDYFTLRPIYSIPAGQASILAKRIASVSATAIAAQASDDQVKMEEAADLIDGVVLDILADFVVAWRLEGPDGPIPKPQTAADLDLLPMALRNNLYGFLTRYRGEKANPTTGD